MSEFLSSNLLLLALVAVGAVVGAATALRRPRIRIALSRAALKVPVAGPLLGSVSVQRICALMGVMLSADISHSEALRTTAEATKSAAVRQDLLNVEADLKDMKLHEAMNRLRHLDPALPALALQSGAGLADPGSNWARYGDYKHRDTSRRAAAISEALQPILITGMGVLVGVFALAFYLPMFQLFSIVTDTADQSGVNIGQ